MSTLSGFCICLIFCLGLIACATAPGHPASGPEVSRPDQVLDFATLYKQNCAGCHGENGKNGVAIALANPVYWRSRVKPSFVRLSKKEWLES